MKAIITKSKESKKGFFTNTIAFETIQANEFLGNQGLLVTKTYYYKTEKSELIDKKGNAIVELELPKFDPEFFNIRVSHYTQNDVDTTTGLVTQTPATALWLDGLKSPEEIEAIIALRAKRAAAETEQA